MPIAIEELNGTWCKTYLIAAAGEAALVDPLCERVQTYTQALRDRGLRLRYVLETHTHADHMMLSREAKEALSAEVLMHEQSPSPLVDRHLREGDVLPLGDSSIRVMHTPGHTPDCVCYLVDGAVLSGDTLLIGGSGRTDFPGGDAAAQYESVMRLFSLPEDTVLWPGHDYKGRTSSTIGVEKRDNPRFSGKGRDEYVEIMANLRLPLPEKIQQALQVNQSGFESGEVSFPLITDMAAIEELSAPALAGQLETRQPPVVFDVREPEEFVGELGHVRGALLLPLDVLERRLPKLIGYADRDVVVVCRAGARSLSACAMLRRAGFSRVRNLAGGMLEWVKAGLPVEH